MKILDFETSLAAIENGKMELSDTNKVSLYQYAPQWLDIVDFDNDAIFLEPCLFYYFRQLMRQETCTMPLAQILWGYSPQNNRPSSLEVFADTDGTIHLPNIGNIHACINRSSKKTINFSDKGKNIVIDDKTLSVEPLKWIKNKQFLICDHKPDNYVQAEVSFLEPIKDSTHKVEKTLVQALTLIQKNIPEFYDAIKMTTREYAIFNSTNYESFTALHYFGTAFLNLAGQNQSEVFFLEDIAHQSGHTMFYTLTHDAAKFLKPNRNTLLKDFTHLQHDHRDIYGAFHGLFTYTTIFQCLHLSFKNKWFEGEKEEEVLARMGFYYEKFAHDLQFQGDSRILTEEGWKYYDMFLSGFEKMKKEYYHIIKYFDYSNQDYSFNFQKFKAINQFQTI
jgi:hypothetical protein